MSTLQEETNGWLQENSRSLLFLAALLLGGGAVMWYLPRAKAAESQTAWQKYSEFQQTLLTADTDDDLNAALAAVEGNDKVYPWALAAAVAWAARMDKDDATLSLLENRLSSLPDNATGAKVLQEGTSVDVADSVETRLAGLRALSQLEAEPVEPTGSKIKVTLTNEAGTNYEIVYQLYENEAPVASAWLLGLIDEGGMGEAKPVPAPQNGFQVSDIPTSEEAANLMVEKAWGCFHSSGTLCTVLESGGDPGQQSRARLQFLGRDLYGQDGVTTVIGKVVEGEDNLAILGELERSTENPQEYAAPLTMTVERVTE